MKLIVPVIAVLSLMLLTSKSNAQCGSGYTQAVLNWDRLDYYYNSTGGAPYQNYISYSMESTQKFAIGPNMVTFETSANGIADGENGTHTGDIAGYTGDDAVFTPTNNGQTITLTFRDNVQNVSFALYDVDYNQILNIDAYNSSNVKQNVSIVSESSTYLTSTSGTNARVDANGTAHANSSNRGTATVTIANTINRIVITVANEGSDQDFWLSDIYACVTGSFPTNYQQTGNNRPLQGPFVNQPDYFLITPDNNSCYMVNTATGEATLLFTDGSNTYMNCFAYDPYNYILYYVSEGWPAVATNKQLKKYDFKTNTISVVLADISTAFNIPTYDQSLEGAGGAFYNGQLYLGVEGGKYDVSGSSNDRTRESLIFRIDFDGSLNPVDICQVFAVPSYLDASNTMIQDWGDFILKDGILINYNSRTSPSSVIKYEHFDMMSGNSTNYTSSSISASQAGMDWDGNLYTFYTNGIRQYNGAGGFNGSIIPITVPVGTWPGGAGDAAENFRPAVDFGDSPTSYDPDNESPAAHATDPLLRIGSSIDLEFTPRGQTAPADADNHDDGIPTIGTFDPNYFQYLVQATIFNNTGENATVCAWLDYDGDGVFDASEGITRTVPSSASPQSIFLYWPMVISPLSHGDQTYLRVRVTRASDQLSTAHATGYFPSGEVEDYLVMVNSYALSTQAFDFDAKLTASKSVKLNWNIVDESDIAYYVIERSKSMSADNWEMVHAETSSSSNGLVNYESIDNNTPAGISYYRLKTVEKDGRIKLSQVKKIENRSSAFSMSIAPNPAQSRTTIFLHADANYDKEANIQIVNTSGAIVFEKQIKLMAGTNSIPVETNSKMSSGHYTVRVYCGDKVLVKTLIIHK